MELLGIILCKAVIAALMLFVIAIIVGVWYAFVKWCNKDILILNIIIFLGLVIITILAALFIVMACIPLLVNPIVVT